VSKLAIIATTLLTLLGAGQPVLAEDEITERCVCGLSTGADAFNAGRPLFADLAKTSANERDLGVDDRARTTQSLLRHHRRSFSADPRPTD
jgi:hypothetical protein